MDYNRAFEESVKIWLALGGASLALLWRRMPPRFRNPLLLMLTLVAGLNYYRFGTDFPFKRVDSYDLIHYYLDPKYFPELGYFSLYPACVIADRENGGPKFGEPPDYMLQDEAGDRHAPIEGAFAEGEAVKARFTPERWAEFTHDFLYLQRDVKGMDKDTWAQLINDHGYNGTTVWTTEALPFVKLVPVEYIKYLCWIDVFLLAGAMAAVRWAYNGTTALWTTLWLFTTYSTRWPTITWALLRYDYVAALIIAMCLLKKARPFAAGAFTAWATALRLFPGLWMFGPAMKGLWGLKERKVHKGLLMLAGGFLIGGAVMQGTAIAVLGTEPVRIHFENMQTHTSAAELSSRRIGLAMALPFRGEVMPKNITNAMRDTVEQQRPLKMVLAGLFLLLLAWAIRKSDDDEAFAVGFLPFFMLTTASYYYYVTRITLTILHAANLEKARHVYGLVFLFGLEAFSNWAEVRYPEHRVFLIGFLSWGIVAYALSMTAWIGWESMRPATPTKAAP